MTAFSSAPAGTSASKRSDNAAPGALGNPESAPSGSATDASVTVNGEGNHKGCPYTEI